MEQKPEHKPIQFKPLTEGLGFHPFADGLPYAPPSKTSTSGTGAVSAGRPQFAFPEKQSEKKYVSAQTVKAAPQPQYTVQTFKPTVAPQPTAVAATSIVPDFGFGYLFVRLFAFTIDTAFNLSLFGSILSTALLNEDLEAVLISRPGAFVWMGLFLAICNWISITGQEIAFGTTLGKRVFGLRLAGTGTDAFVRALFFIPSVIFSGLGVFICIFDRKKRCWHDRASGLQPTYH